MKLPSKIDPDRLLKLQLAEESLHAQARDAYATHNDEIKVRTAVLAAIEKLQFEADRGSDREQARINLTEAQKRLVGVNNRIEAYMRAAQLAAANANSAGQIHAACETWLASIRIPVVAGASA